jgi:hypothetical protein
VPVLIQSWAWLEVNKNRGNSSKKNRFINNRFLTM